MVTDSIFPAVPVAVNVLLRCLFQSIGYQQILSRGYGVFTLQLTDRTIALKTLAPDASASKTFKIKDYRSVSVSGTSHCQLQRLSGGVIGPVRCCFLNV